MDDAPPPLAFHRRQYEAGEADDVEEGGGDSGFPILFAEFVQIACRGTSRVGDEDIGRSEAFAGYLKPFLEVFQGTKITGGGKDVGGGKPFPEVFFGVLERVCVKGAEADPAPFRKECADHGISQASASGADHSDFVF